MNTTTTMVCGQRTSSNRMHILLIKIYIWVISHLWYSIANTLDEFDSIDSSMWPIGKYFHRFELRTKTKKEKNYGESDPFNTQTYD